MQRTNAMAPNRLAFRDRMHRHGLRLSRHRSFLPKHISHPKAWNVCPFGNGKDNVIFRALKQVVSLQLAADPTCFDSETEVGLCIEGCIPTEHKLSDRHCLQVPCLPSRVSSTTNCRNLLARSCSLNSVLVRIRSTCPLSDLEMDHPFRGASGGV